MNFSALILFKTFLSVVAHFQEVDHYILNRVAPFVESEETSTSWRICPYDFHFGIHFGNHSSFLFYKIFTHMARHAPITVAKIPWFQLFWKTIHVFDMPHPGNAKISSTQNNL